MPSIRRFYAEFRLKPVDFGLTGFPYQTMTLLIMRRGSATDANAELPIDKLLLRIVYLGNSASHKLARY